MIYRNDTPNEANMFFDDYKQHADAQVRASLLWEYDLARFDWQKMRTLVVQRVVERGRRDGRSPGAAAPSPPAPAERRSPPGPPPGPYRCVSAAHRRRWPPGGGS